MKATSTKMNVIIADGSRELTHQTLELFVADAQKAISRRQRFCVAVSRQTPRTFFESLGTEPESKALAWDKIHFFWVDQCCNSPDLINSTHRMAACTFIPKVGIPAENVHLICSRCRGCEYAASVYEQTIYSVFGLRKDKIPRFDLIMLGMGADGHIASLFPDTYTFFESKDLVRATYFMDGRGTRITLTHPVLHRARHIAVQVCGREKAQVLRRVFAARPDELRYPIHTIWPILDKVTWLIDRAAAGSLPLGNRSINIMHRKAESIERYDRRLGR